MKNERALVLGGGGITGIAWESGVLAALIENGMKISQIDKIFGTSAGAFVGAVLSNNQDMKSYYHYLNENKDPNEQTKLKKKFMRCGDRLIFRVEITKKVLDDYLER